MLNKLHILISISAGIIFTIISIVLGKSLTYWLPNLIVVMVCFFLIGLYIRRYIRDKILCQNTEEDTNEVEIEEAKSILDKFNDEE